LADQRSEVRTQSEWGERRPSQDATARRALGKDYGAAGIDGGSPNPKIAQRFSAGVPRWQIKEVPKGRQAGLSSLTGLTLGISAIFKLNRAINRAKRDREKAERP